MDGKNLVRVETKIGAVSVSESEIIHFSEQLEVLDFSHPKQILQHLILT